jgi:hypothetical protein
MKDTHYKSLILEAYEDEVAGAAYFDGVALLYPEHSSFLQRCAALERETANRLIVLLRKYQLTPSAQAALEQRGTGDARMAAAGDWNLLMRQSINSYVIYVEEFQALEAMGPAEDRPILAALTAHEVQLIEWMQTESRILPPHS